MKSAVVLAFIVCYFAHGVYSSTLEPETTSGELHESRPGLPLSPSSGTIRKDSELSEDAMNTIKRLQELEDKNGELERQIDKMRAYKSRTDLLLSPSSAEALKGPQGDLSLSSSIQILESFERERHTSRDQPVFKDTTQQLKDATSGGIFIFEEVVSNAFILAYFVKLLPVLIELNLSISAQDGFHKEKIIELLGQTPETTTSRSDGGGSSAVTDKSDKAQEKMDLGYDGGPVMEDEEPITPYQVLQRHLPSQLLRSYQQRIIDLSISSSSLLSPLISTLSVSLSWLLSAPMLLSYLNELQSFMAGIIKGFVLDFEQNSSVISDFSGKLKTFICDLLLRFGIGMEAFLPKSLGLYLEKILEIFEIESRPFAQPLSEHNTDESDEGRNKKQVRMPSLKTLFYAFGAFGVFCLKNTLPFLLSQLKNFFGLVYPFLLRILSTPVDIPGVSDYILEVGRVATRDLSRNFLILPSTTTTLLHWICLIAVLGNSLLSWRLANDTKGNEQLKPFHNHAGLTRHWMFIEKQELEDVIDCIEKFPGKIEELQRGSSENWWNWFTPNIIKKLTLLFGTLASTLDVLGKVIGSNLKSWTKWLFCFPLKWLSLCLSFPWVLPEPNPESIEEMTFEKQREYKTLMAQFKSKKQNILILEKLSWGYDYFYQLLPLLNVFLPNTSNLGKEDATLLHYSRIFGCLLFKLPSKLLFVYCQIQKLLLTLKKTILSSSSNVEMFEMLNDESTKELRWIEQTDRKLDTKILGKLSAKEIVTLLNVFKKSFLPNESFLSTFKSEKAHHRNFIWLLLNHCPSEVNLDEIEGGDSEINLTTFDSFWSLGFALESYLPSKFKIYLQLQFLDLLNELMNDFDMSNARLDLVYSTIGINKLMVATVGNIPFDATDGPVPFFIPEEVGQQKTTEKEPPLIDRYRDKVKKREALSSESHKDNKRKLGDLYEEILRTSSIPPSAITSVSTKNPDTTSKEKTIKTRKSDTSKRTTRHSKGRRPLLEKKKAPIETNRKEKIPNPPAQIEKSKDTPSKVTSSSSTSPKIKPVISSSRSSISSPLGSQRHPPFSPPIPSSLSSLPPIPFMPSYKGGSSQSSPIDQRDSYSSQGSGSTPSPIWEYRHFAQQEPLPPQPQFATYPPNTQYQHPPLGMSPSQQQRLQYGAPLPMTSYPSPPYGGYR